MDEYLTPSQLVAAATEELLSGGYREYRGSKAALNGLSRIFEDSYGIVALHVYETWGALEQQWHEAQGRLVDLITANFARSEPKAWEGYLVLLTPAFSDSPQRVGEIQRNTQRVRKLVATGGELRTLANLKGVLLPLLPLGIEDRRDAEPGLLDRLPDLLENHGIRREVTAVVAGAFQRNESILDALDRSRRNNEASQY